MADLSPELMEKIRRDPEIQALLAELAELLGTDDNTGN